MRGAGRHELLSYPFLLAFGHFLPAKFNSIESEVDPGKQATENPTVAHYIRFVRGFETRIRRTVITGEVKNSRMLRRRGRSVCTARKRQVPGTFN